MIALLIILCCSFAANLLLIASIERLTLEGDLERKVLKAVTDEDIEICLEAVKREYVVDEHEINNLMKRINKTKNIKNRRDGLVYSEWRRDYEQIDR